MTDASLLRTPLYDLHAAAGARFTPFAGYEMPVQYPDGVLKEHLHTRGAAGLFDVSHMGQITVRAKSGAVADAGAALERLVPVDVVGLKPGRQRYAVFTNDAGGILDDLMIAHRGDHFLLVVNAACKADDLARLRADLDSDCAVELLDDRALLALQGPAAEAELARLAQDVAGMRFMDVADVDFLDARAVVSRSGYTGEDGFEISVPAERAPDLASALLEGATVAWIGLGARDSLRLEAGLCLYGADLDATTTPVEAALEWAIQKVRRPGGGRAGGYPGAEKIGAQLTDGAARRRVGLRPNGRAPIRAPASLFESETATDAVGAVTSGGFGPTLGAPISMAYIPTRLATPGTAVFAEVRGTRLETLVATTPFVAQNYKRA